MLDVLGPGTEYRLTPPFLLPVAIAPGAMDAKARSLVASHPEARASREAARMRSMAAFMLLCAGSAREAEAILRDAVEAQRGAADGAGLASSELRLVQVLQRLERVDEAVDLAHGVVGRLQRESSPSLHFALHHLGKAQLQAGIHAGARSSLLRALEIRVKLEQPDLIESTRAALDLLAEERRGS